MRANISLILIATALGFAGNATAAISCTTDEQCSSTLHCTGTRFNMCEEAYCLSSGVCQPPLCIKPGMSCPVCNSHSFVADGAQLTRSPWSERFRSSIWSSVQYCTLEIVQAACCSYIRRAIPRSSHCNKSIHTGARPSSSHPTVRPVSRSMRYSLDGV